MTVAARRVLLVEDSPTQAERIRKLLADDGLTVVLVRNAELALAELEHNRPDLIILDNHLPGMDGNQFCREIRLNVNTRAIPVLMLTAENSDAAQMRGLASGADDYVVKTVDPDILRFRVRALLRKAEADQTIPDVESRFRQARVLVIDDSPTFLYIAQKELETEHYLVETAEGADKGLKRLEEAPADCVLVDFEMPSLDGGQVCRLIRQSHVEAEPEIVLIMISSHEDKGHMTEAFDAGADDYIAKSTDFSVTKARIRALLRRKFLVEENRRISEEIREKELAAIRAQAERAAAEVRAEMADKLRVANQELDRANQELEQFAYAAAHDLQEPLRKVRLFSELLSRKFGSQLEPEAAGYITQCIDGARRMQQMIADLLSYARSSHAGPASQPVDLQMVLDRVRVNLQGLIEETSATITAGVLPKVLVEEVRLTQIFQNLVGNALKYRRPDQPPRIVIAAEREGDEWVISVADNGVGIGHEYQKRIFDAFQRLHSHENPGTGLGLAICKRVIENAGGRLWVESEPGQGSTFRFTLRVVNNEAEASAL